MRVLANTAAAKGEIKLHSGIHAIGADRPLLKIVDGPSRKDTSQALIFVKMPLKEGADVPKLTEELQSFVTNAKPEGRTLLFPGTVGLSVLNAEASRYELLAAIAKDLKKVGEIFSDGFHFTLAGLDQRIQVHRIGVTEVELYLNYRFSLSPK